MVRLSKYLIMFILLSKVVVKGTTNFITKFCSERKWKRGLAYL